MKSLMAIYLTRIHYKVMGIVENVIIKIAPIAGFSLKIKGLMKIF